MPVNLEIKARISDIDSIKKITNEIGAKYSQELIQTDTYFNTKSGRLKLREIAETGAELIFYQRSETTNKRKSDFSIYKTQNPDQLKNLLTRSYGIKGVVRKKRELYMYGETRIHLDSVSELGNFIEFEIPVTSNNEDQSMLIFLMEKFEIEESSLINGSYIDLYLESV
ncbi:MAG: class IV adenylate cyclase [Ignavibacteriales bacterium]|nr:class IV adenylate cyclase [Ignavibacteriales bacterium]